MGGVEYIGKVFLVFYVWLFLWQVFDGVVWNQVYVCVQIVGDVVEFVGLIDGVVDVFDQDKFQSYYVFVFFGECVDCGNEFGKWICFVDGYDFFVNFVGCVME